MSVLACNPTRAGSKLREKEYGMYIHEAVMAATENGLCITRLDAWWGEHIKIKPTDTADCCIMIPQEGQTGKRWNPRREDLLADDWIVTE